MEILEKPVNKDYNKSLLKTVAVLYRVHNELLVQLAELVKHSENDTERYTTELELINLISAESISTINTNSQDLIELITLMKEKMNTLLTRTLQQTA
jgi:hypothetical protein